MTNLLSIRTLLSVITGLLVVLLVSIFAYSANEAFEKKQVAARMLSIVNLMRITLAAKENIRIEGGVAHAASRAPEAASDETVARMFDLRARTDGAVGSMIAQVRKALPRGTSPELVEVRRTSSCLAKSFPPKR